MRFDSQAPSGDEPSSTSPGDGPDDPAERRRRRTTRAWSAPMPPADRSGPPDPNWGRSQPAANAGAVAGSPSAGGTDPGTRLREAAGRSRRTPVIPPLDPPAIPPPPAGPVPGLLAEVRAELAQLRELVRAQAEAPATGAITGQELAASIEALGTTLGTGMASLLSDHRALLARDVEAAADRILEEVGQRLRTAGTQTVDAVEERIRHVSTKATSDLSDQLELRLDQIQAEVTGLRAVMLEIPDQTVVSARLDQLADAITSARARESRVSPAVTAAIGKALAGPLAQLESAIAAVGEAVHGVLDERLPEDLPDAASLEALTHEMTALRRRITLRTDEGAAPDDERADDDDAADWVDEDGWIEATPINTPRKATPRRKAPPAPSRTTPTSKATGTRKPAPPAKATKATKATKAAKVTKKVTPAKRTLRAR